MGAAPNPRTLTGRSGASSHGLRFPLRAFLRFPGCPPGSSPSSAFPWFPVVRRSPVRPSGRCPVPVPLGFPPVSLSPWAIFTLALRRGGSAGVGPRRPGPRSPALPPPPRLDRAIRRTPDGQRLGTIGCRHRIACSGRPRAIGARVGSPRIRRIRSCPYSYTQSHYVIVLAGSGQSPISRWPPAGRFQWPSTLPALLRVYSLSVQRDDALCRHVPYMAGKHDRRKPLRAVITYGSASMEHTSRCGSAKTDPKKCRCSCGGGTHGGGPFGSINTASNPIANVRTLTCGEVDSRETISKSSPSKSGKDRTVIEEIVDWLTANPTVKDQVDSIAKLSATSRSKYSISTDMRLAGRNSDPVIFCADSWPTSRVPLMNSNSSSTESQSDIAYSRRQERSNA